MGKVLKISKDMVIEAILNEPLEGGFYFHSNNGGADDGVCRVCAVGAVLRTAARDSGKLGIACGEIAFNLTDGTHSHDLILEAYESGNFWAILSTEFEYAYRITRSMVDLRTHMLYVIEAHCPKFLTLEVPSA